MCARVSSERHVTADIISLLEILLCRFRIRETRWKWKTWSRAIMLVFLGQVLSAQQEQNARRFFRIEKRQYYNYDVFVTTRPRKHLSRCNFAKTRARETYLIVGLFKRNNRVAALDRVKPYLAHGHSSWTQPALATGRRVILETIISL